jgi:hypothetical protein
MVQRTNLTVLASGGLLAVGVEEQEVLQSQVAATILAPAGPSQAGHKPAPPHQRRSSASPKNAVLPS